ncbi:MAG: ArsR/SmtB family transcription factor [Streptosporangiaceae bacterium]
MSNQSSGALSGAGTGAAGVGAGTGAAGVGAGAGAAGVGAVFDAEAGVVGANARPGEGAGVAGADAVFDALGEPVRRRILELLHEGPTPVGQLAERLPVGRPAVSKHLRVLTNAGLVEHHPAGTRNLYALAPDGMAAAQQWLVQTWDTVLAAYAAEISRQREKRSSP